MDLGEWLVLYIKHKDAQRLKGVEREGQEIVFSYADHAMRGIVMEQLSPVKAKEKTIIATLHTKKNVQELIARWKEFCAHPDLTIVFANPSRNEKWSIRPRTHDAVAGGPNGIWSVADGVPYL